MIVDVRGTKTEIPKPAENLKNKELKNRVRVVNTGAIEATIKVKDADFVTPESDYLSLVLRKKAHSKFKQIKSSTY